MTDARHVFTAAVSRTDGRRDNVESARAELARLEASLAEAEQLESEALSALCAQTLQPTKVTT